MQVAKNTEETAMNLDTQQGASAASARPSGGSPALAEAGLHSTPLMADTLAFLEEQHLTVNRLFAALDGAATPGDRAEVFARVADALAIHTAIEERYFYPAIRTAGTEDLLLDSLHEHLEIKRAIVDLVQLSASDEMFEEKLATLRELVSRHIEEDESELFPRVRRLFTRQALLPVVEQMQEQVVEMEGTDARFRVFPETVDPARL
jgi:hemerythrin-like domain-containing protein